MVVEFEQSRTVAFPGLKFVIDGPWGVRTKKVVRGSPFEKKKKYFGI